MTGDCNKQHAGHLYCLNFTGQECGRKLEEEIGQWVKKEKEKRGIYERDVVPGGRGEAGK